MSCTFHGLHPPVVGEHPEIGLTPPAMHCVNAIPYVVAAEPGIKTYLDLPLLAGRASSRVVRRCSPNFGCLRHQHDYRRSKGIVNAGDSTPPSTSKILPVTNDDAGDAR